VSVLVITAVGTWVTTRIVEPRLGRFDPSLADDTARTAPPLEPLTAAEKRGLRRAGVAAIAMIAVFVHLAGPGPLAGALDWVPGFGVLRDPATGGLLSSPFMRGVVAMIFVFFVVPGFVYGRAVGTLRNDRDVIDAMAGAMSSMGLYIVLVFFAAQFVKYFEWTNFGAIVAVVGADAIVALGLDNPLVFIPFILMCCFVNLMLGSASAQWAITAPIFVPMLMRVGYSPEVIQAAYRIGDSTTNIITPMMSYFGIIYAMACRYRRKLGIGTLISMMLPYSLAFIVAWTILFYVWVFVAGLPVGPGAPTTYPGP
jgi:aminobenzoyl-glutamate transport protein